MLSGYKLSYSDTLILCVPVQTVVINIQFVEQPDLPNKMSIKYKFKRCSKKT